MILAGQELLNFSSNDYLGLANESTLKEAACHAIEKYGTGSGASRLICGSLRPHHELEECMAAFKGTEAALSFSTGYAAAVGVISALLGKADVIILDKLVHASIVDAARLSGAQIRVFPHNDLDRLDHLLDWADRGGKAQNGRVLVVTESVFSMDGDQAPLREIVQLKDKHGAWLMVDEAHATGLYGAKRSGLAEHLGVSGRIEIQMSTLGKALGASGGCICGSRRLIDYLVNRARAFIFSTAPAPAAAAAAAAGVRLVQSPLGETRCQRLWERVSELQTGLGLNCGEHEFRSAIVPIMVGAETRALEASTGLRQEGILIPAIRYPTVARGSARLRLTLSASHTADDVNRVLTSLVRLGLTRLSSETALSPNASAGQA